MLSRPTFREISVDDPIVADYLDEWLRRRHGHLRPTTARGYGEVIRYYLAPQLGDLRLSQLNRRTLERTYATLLISGGKRGRGLAPRTVQYAAAVLHRACEDAVLDGLIAANPAHRARAPRLDPDADEADDRLQVWTAEQVGQFLAFVDDHPLRCLWHLALGTGMRRGEMLGLRWCDVDLDGQQVAVRRALSVVGSPRLLRTKTSRSRTLAIGMSVVDALQRRRAEQDRHRAVAQSWQDRWGLVFTTAAGAPIEPGAVSQEWRSLMRHAPVPKIRLHDTRHTHASLLLEGGTPIKVVSERLGHASISMTLNVYAHVLPAMDADAVARLDAAIHPGLA